MRPYLIQELSKDDLSAMSFLSITNLDTIFLSKRHLALSSTSVIHARMVYSFLALRISCFVSRVCHCLSIALK